MENQEDITIIQVIKYIRNAFIHVIHVMEKEVQQVIIVLHARKIIHFLMKMNL